VTAPARLILVRHGLAAGHGERVIGSLNVRLLEDGAAQAERLAGRLAPERVAAVYSSPLARALDTARPLAERLGLEPVVVPDLRELDFGVLEGLTLTEVEELHPELLAWTAAPAAVALPGGETVEALAARAIAATRAIAAAHAAETAVVVSHGVTLRAVLADALGMQLDRMFRLDLTHGAFSVVDWFGDLPLVRSVNVEVAL
jgi:broad specificity phosphatase PhoE